MELTATKQRGATELTASTPKETVHYGSEQPEYRTTNITLSPTSSGVSEGASE